MTQGRIPKPKILNDLSGCSNNRRKYDSEVEPLAGVPDCPRHLDEIAKQEWEDITATLEEMNLLSRCDAKMIELYCVAYSRFRQAVAKIEDEGEYIYSQSGYAQISPWSGVVSSTTEQMKKLLIEFGLSPASRARMRVPTKEKNERKGWLKVS